MIRYVVMLSIVLRNKNIKILYIVCHCRYYTYQLQQKQQIFLPIISKTLETNQFEPWLMRRRNIVVFYVARTFQSE